MRSPGAFRIHSPMSRSEAEALAAEITATGTRSAYTQESWNVPGTFLVFFWVPNGEYPAKVFDREHWTEIQAWHVS